MTAKQFKGISVGDEVILPFSETPCQRVISINEGMLETSPDNNKNIVYRNHYKSIHLPEEYEVKVSRKLLQEIYEIAKNATHIVEDWSYGDFYPQESEEPLFPKHILNELHNLLK